MAGFFEGQHLGVLDSFIAVKALANNDAILHNDSPHERIRLYLAFALGGECEREIKKIQIEFSVTSFTQDERLGDHDKFRRLPTFDASYQHPPKCR